MKPGGWLHRLAAHSLATGRIRNRNETRPPLFSSKDDSQSGHSAMSRT
ncbi:Uncharacterised protein [Pseudomonas fragi]|uniref:Uncharacterized protein n=1 Tax=Pseudomonas fragi TaxID=296 RepID=A0A449IHL8_PSEFR|nr:Uncharacterised protein [Pseudomonas fragi]